MASLDQKEFFHSDCTVNPLRPDEVFLFVLTLNLIPTKNENGFEYKTIFNTP